MQSAPPEFDYVLGIDLGPSSLGWAVVRCEAGHPKELVQTGVRRFEAGVQGDIEKGMDESRAIQRRKARGPRRQHWRRQHRLSKVFRILSRSGLLPAAPDASADTRHGLLLELDEQLRSEWGGAIDRVSAHVFPYRLRARALDECLPLRAFGRALYHLAQRRGYMSNRKTSTSEEDRGVVKRGIDELSAAMDRTGARTLGEYFSKLDPEETRIRARWTARGMFKSEFDEIWKAQASHHANVLTDTLKQELFDAIFDQRPLKSQSHRIGRCELEPRRRRAPLACLPAQRFRLLQKVNDLLVTCPDGESRKLRPDEWQTLVNALNGEGDLSWADTRTRLKFKKSKEYGRNYTFNFEEGGDKKLVGNRTGAKLRAAMGDAWTALPLERQATLVDEILSFESEEALSERLQKHWRFAQDVAVRTASIVLEPGYAAHSRRAIGGLLPKMEEGIAYATAKKQVYGDREIRRAPMDRLPPILTVLLQLTNPAVLRATSELRKVVNAIVRQYGKPRLVRVELARDLKHSRDRRQQLMEIRDANEKANDSAAADILKEMKDERYNTPINRLKVRLAYECGWHCPYTNRPICMETLVGDTPQFDIEHIIPFSRSFDNAFGNKTLCYHEVNRHVKKRKTPFEAFGSSREWPEILERVRRFNAPIRLLRRKLALFETERLPDREEFINRLLSDTRYLAVAAREYLGLLFGGVVDSEGRLRVQVTPGGCTSFLRSAWNLNSILGHPDNKNRGDHRHHAIDAVVIALTNPTAIEKLSKAAEIAEQRGLPHLMADPELPWPEFVNDVRREIDRTVVSSRVDRRLNGPLHKDTILSHPKTGMSAALGPVHHLRKPLSAMSLREVENIVDQTVRQVVQERLRALDVPPDKAFADASQHPHMVSKKDPRRIIPIHSARIRMSDRPIEIGKSTKRRFVNPGENHHTEIVAILGPDGTAKRWDDVVVSRYAATQRLDRREPIIQLDHGQNRHFVFSLAGGEYIEWRCQT